MRYQAILKALLLVVAAMALANWARAGDLPEPACQQLREAARAFKNEVEGQLCSIDAGYRQPGAQVRRDPERALGRLRELELRVERAKRTITWMRRLPNVGRAGVVATLGLSGFVVVLLGALDPQTLHNIATPFLSLSNGGIFSALGIGLYGDLIGPARRITAQAELDLIEDCFLGELDNLGVRTPMVTGRQVVRLTDRFDDLRLWVRQQSERAEAVTHGASPDTLWQTPGMNREQCQAQPTGVRVALPSAAALTAENEVPETAGTRGAGICRSSATLPIELPSWVRPTPAQLPAPQPIARCQPAALRLAALPYYQAALSHRVQAALEHGVGELAAPLFMIGGAALAAGATAPAAGTQLLLRLAPQVAGGATATVFALARNAGAAELPPEDLVMLFSGTQNQCVASRSDLCSNLRRMVSEPNQPCANAEPRAGVWEMGPARCYEAATALNEVLSSPELMCERLPVSD